MLNQPTLRMTIKKLVEVMSADMYEAMIKEATPSQSIVIEAIAAQAMRNQDQGVEVQEHKYLEITKDKHKYVVPYSLELHTKLVEEEVESKIVGLSEVNQDKTIDLALVRELEEALPYVEDQLNLFMGSMGLSKDNMKGANIGFDEKDLDEGIEEHQGKDPKGIIGGFIPRTINQGIKETLAMLREDK